MRTALSSRCGRSGLATVAMMLLACGLQAQSASAGARTVAEALVSAFNEHDAAAMAQLVTPDFELFYMNDQGAAELALRGPRDLAVEMESYFANQPDVQSTITAVVDGPVYVSFREQIVGGDSSLAVYEVREGLIRRVWYYPAESG